MRITDIGCFGLVAALASCTSGGASVSAKGDGSVILGVDGSVVAGPDAGFCQSTGPVVTVGTGTSSHQECTGQIAQTTFLNALCTCGDTKLVGYLNTRAFDSSQGSYDPSSNLGGGAVGINGAFSVGAGDTDIGGSLSIAGPQSLNFTGYLRVGGDLRLAGASTVTGYTEVDRDAWFGGSFTDLGPLKVKRNLHSSGSVFAIPTTVSGQTVPGAVSISPPCPCSASDFLDVAAIVADGQAHNDNAANGISPDALKNVLLNAELTLPCGRTYLSEISGVGQVTVHVTGRAAVFVGGSVNALGALSFKLENSGELDLFVAKDLILTGSCSFGDKSRPAGARIYVGGSGEVSLFGSAGFVGNVYAPHSKVSAVGYADVYGSIVAGEFDSPGYAHFVYDRAVTTAGSSCPPVNVPGACRKCGDCTDGSGCVNGTCSACAADTDCCGQFTCSGGKCTPVIN
jgi:hypothetical protein